MLARVCGLTLAMNIRPPFTALSVSPGTSHSRASEGAESSAFRTSVCDCNDTRTASADVTHPEQARQSVRDICAGGEFPAASLSSVVTSYGFYHGNTNISQPLQS